MKFLVVISSLVAVALARSGYSYGPVQHGYHGPTAPLAHDGRVVDTPEVAHAKAAHLAAHTEVASKVAYGEPVLDDRAYGYGNGYYGDHSSLAAYNNGGHGGYHGPPAPLDHKGRVIDTPDVAHAKLAHFAAHADAVNNAHYAPVARYDDGDYGHVAAHSYGSPAHGYHGPAAPLGHDGRVVDTPEVAHAKAAHLAAHTEVSAHSPYYGGYGAYETHGLAYKW